MSKVREAVSFIRSKSIVKLLVEMLEPYNGSFENLVDSIVSNREAPQQLKNLRDTLLPKLMSGVLEAIYYNLKRSPGLVRQLAK